MVEEGKKYRCVLISTTTGKKPTKSRVKEKTFMQGQKIDLMAVNVSGMPNGYALAFQTKDGYILPNIAVNTLYELGLKDNSKYEDATVLEENGKKKLSNQEAIRNELTKGLKSKSKASVYGAIIGGGFMLFRAYKTGGSKVLYTALGVIGGGFIGHHLTINKK